MIDRIYWKRKIEECWKQKSILWLSGVRRSGKTVLCKSLDSITYFDCELPSVREVLSNTESFLEKTKGQRLVLDEIHKLKNPSELLKIAADYYPETRIIATGSSTLGASKRFSDTLTGRKTSLWLTPMTAEDLKDFNQTDIETRLHSGGLPPFFLGEREENRFQEWIDSFWSRDISELFNLGRKSSFQKMLELLFVQSGSIFEATRFAHLCEASRQTIHNYLAILQETWVAHTVRPFSSRKSNEIVAAPKIYAFDTGFVCHFKGWNTLRKEDLGLLWEHYTLNQMHSYFQRPGVRYWRDKQGHEIDFIILDQTQNPITVECKWDANGFDSRNLQVFRKKYSQGENWVVCRHTLQEYTQLINGLPVRFMGMEEMTSRLASCRL
ncbi:MAG: hypothetical protein A2268_07085 [Candidatus Raymondbacteria bacterium RifOxyA12_full_50_37]|uniref:ATPase n=1 Tax=Candidatus Raymondbacteria bacterium RIFOXYD12_FULL_49_13 TaxID=1817890 RepID=A0A1F7FEA8_UNCRA|nr:MAG: hypothetical protein A2350_20840 [Candidatus Raymondbacteria bacterium RifOxyB12_full_50_8]OGJ89739.1 MAG: hypothetical protein A2268_07085 [Candidatus Raymondbacteria bacterium RifOxyA12_full_50_37]OGJ91148.1 MAG: hypothetical protein A2248_01235 [Candidatus Raymondbacteria bacterium RIFOXYA2_FULL_49_16]OGJ95184.1 MAG: hypothetical protein A2487_12380 [Candidatus Raymondbacteria bacterium RifOxyC12_full_50_8]OGJ97546.1 MAG: hypothetical protein A2453_02000 [Candidatus Raymondbacteria b